MTLFRLLLAVLLIFMAIYTGITISEHGWNFLPVYFSDVADFGWRGQFDVDFSCFLALSAVWLMWRHHFSAAGIVLGLSVFVGGALLLTAYLLIVSFRTNGNVTALLLGEQRASQA